MIKLFEKFEEFKEINELKEDIHLKAQRAYRARKADEKVAEKEAILASLNEIKEKAKKFGITFVTKTK